MLSSTSENSTGLYVPACKWGECFRANMQHSGALSVLQQTCCCAVERGRRPKHEQSQHPHEEVCLKDHQARVASHHPHTTTSHELLMCQGTTQRQVATAAGGVGRTSVSEQAVDLAVDLAVLGEIALIMASLPA